MNYDSYKDRKKIQQQAWLDDTELLVLDGLHKMPDWKNAVKGIFDTKPRQMRLLITGSAGLETFRQSGDSLAGRFCRNRRVMPFSATELKLIENEVDHNQLLNRGGFPESFLAEDVVEADC